MMCKKARCPSHPFSVSVNSLHISHRIFLFVIRAMAGSSDKEEGHLWLSTLRELRDKLAGFEDPEFFGRRCLKTKGLLE
jgi:hypothetical protein